MLISPWALRHSTCAYPAFSSLPFPCSHCISVSSLCINLACTGSSRFTSQMPFASHCSAWRNTQGSRQILVTVHFQHICTRWTSVCSGVWTSNLQAVRFKTWLLVCREAQSLQTGIPQAASFSVLLDFFRSARFADWWSEAWQLHTNKGACSDLNEVLAIFLRRLFN